MRPYAGGTSRTWTDEMIARARLVLGRHRTLAAAAAELGVSASGLQSAFWARREQLGGGAREFLFGGNLSAGLTGSTQTQPQPQQTKPAVTERAAGSVAEHKPPIAEPGTVMGRVARSVARLGDTKPGRYRLAHVTDLHGGSKHFDGKALLDFLALAKSMGVCAVLDTGDNADGAKDVLLPEQREPGMDGQHEELCDLFAAAKLDVPVWAISGNHDGYNDAAIGCDSGAILAVRMRERGVQWHHLGSCLGRVTVHGARIELWHGAGGSGTRNAVRRVLNHRAESYVGGDTPHVLLVGHYHRYAQFVAYPEGIFCVSGGTFQRKRSEFANRIAHPWDIGGGILSFTVRDDGSVGEFAYEFFPAKVSDALGWGAA